MITLTICAAILISIVVWILIKFIQLRPYNQSPLSIRTFDGDDSPYHPSVLYFKNGWNGWKYWMAETPYYKHCQPYRDRNECPSIHVSNDGKHWTEPDGLTNPIVNFGDAGEKGLDYFSDPHLVYIPERNEIECWYRLTERKGRKDYFDTVSLRKVSTRDGVNWGDEEIISQLDENKYNQGLGNVIVSPALLYQDGNYRMWYVDSEIGNSFNNKEPRDIAYSESKDGITWVDKKICTLDGCSDCNPWHIDVAYHDGIYFLTIFGDKILRLFESTDCLNFNFVKEILRPAPVFGSFYSFGLYRSCLIKSNGKYQLYFSADDGFHTHIGIMEGEKPRNLEVVNVEDNDFQNPITLLSFYLKKLRFVAKQMIK